MAIFAILLILCAKKILSELVLKFLFSVAFSPNSEYVLSSLEISIKIISQWQWPGEIRGQSPPPTPKIFTLDKMDLILLNTNYYKK